MIASPTGHTADLIIIGFLVISGLIGLISGFTRLFLSMTAWIGSGLLALASAPALQPLFMQLIPHQLPALIAAGALTFIISLSLLIYLGHTIGAAIKSSSLSGVDRSLGMLFGLTMGATLFSGLFNFAPKAFSKDSYERFMKQARFGPYLEQGAALTRGAAWVVASRIAGFLPGAVSTSMPAVVPEQDGQGIPLLGPTHHGPSSQSIGHSGDQEVEKGRNLKGYEGGERTQIEQLIQGVEEAFPEENDIKLDPQPVQVEAERTAL